MMPHESEKGHFSISFLNKPGAYLHGFPCSGRAMPTTLGVGGNGLQVCLCSNPMPLTGTSFLPSAPCSVYTVG